MGACKVERTSPVRKQHKKRVKEVPFYVVEYLLLQTCFLKRSVRDVAQDKMVTCGLTFANKTVNAFKLANPNLPASEADVRKLIKHFNIDRAKPSGGRQPSLKCSQEAQLFDYVRRWCSSDMPRNGIGLLKSDALAIMNQYRTVNGFKTTCGRKAVEAFFARHKKQINLKGAKYTDIGRWKACTKEAMTEHFKELTEVLFDEHHKPKGFKQILSVDETALLGTNFVLKQNHKVFCSYMGSETAQLHKQLGNHVTLVGFADVVCSMLFISK
jgi:hypothetical protein